VGIALGAQGLFDVGVASGNVYILLSLGIEYQYGGGNNSLTILLRLAVGGEVVVLGIISIAVLLSLEARYTDSGALVCQGHLEVKVKICWCFTLEVNQDIVYTLVGGSKSSESGKDKSGGLESASLTHESSSDTPAAGSNPGHGNALGSTTKKPPEASDHVKLRVEQYMGSFA